MKSLRQLLRRSQSTERSPKRRAKRLGATNRRLSTQALEQRQLLAGDLSPIGGDLSPAHNYWNSFDVNQDLQISPGDALRVINYIAENAEGELSGDFDGNKVDVNGDGDVTPIDALNVINALGRGEGVGELVELFLNARDLNDDPLPLDNGIVEVGTGIENAFFLEVSYNDLRTFGNDIGAFTVVTDIGVSQSGVLQPVLRETQRITIGGSVQSASSGDLTLTRENTGAMSTVTLEQLGDGPVAAIRNAFINDLGYSADDIVVEEFPTADPADFGIQIRYVRQDDGNVDKDDVSIVSNFDVSVPVNFQEFAPFLADGVTPNSDAVRFNINTLSRTFPNDSGTGFGQPFYENLNRGAFDLATGFDDVGGAGGVPNSGGIPGLAGEDDLFEPFDAFSLEVFLNAPVSGLVIDVNPGESTDALTLYGEDDEVTEDMIFVREGARVTISTAGGVNTPPTLGTSPLTPSFTEDDANSSIDLLQDASDADGDSLSVTNVMFVSGDNSGFSLNGNFLDIMPDAYNALPQGDSQVVVYSYDVTDGTDPVSQTVSITVSGVNDAPEVSAEVTATVNVAGSTTNVDLLANASDPDTGDTLDVTSVTLDSGDDSGITFDDTNNQLVVDPSAYTTIPNGQSIDVVFSYDVVDGNGGSTPQVVTVTIENTENDPPVVGNPVTASFSEDDADATVSLLTNVTDPEGDTLTIVNFSVDSGDASGISQNGTSLSVSPNAYNALPTGQNEVISISYQVSDGTNAPVDHAATITIGGANDNPVVSGALTPSFNEDAGNVTVDLLEGASDPDTGDTLSTANLTRVSGDDSGFSQNGDSLNIDTSVYNSLAVGETETIVFTYDVQDNNSGSTAQSATITITGANDAPTVGAVVTDSFSEDDASGSVDLLLGASDPDTNDTLSVSDLTPTGGDTSGITQNGNSLTVDPSAYNGLAEGATETITFTYNVTDGNGGSAAQSATITISGVNDAPELTGTLTITLDEDQAARTLSLLEGASDPDGDTLSVINLAATGDLDGVTLNGTTFELDPTAYGDMLADGETANATLTYQVTDGTVPVDQTYTITITGRDEDVPSVSGPITVSFDEDDDSDTVDLLVNASHPSNDTLSVINAVVTDGDASGVTIDAANNQLIVDPSAYNDLNTGQSEVVVVSYDIQDEDGDTVSTTATVTIVGEDEPLIQPSTISGQLWIDEVENRADVGKGAAPIRDGVRGEGEDGLGGVLVTLFSVDEFGNETPLTSTLTDADGEYIFEDLDPGHYVVEYDIPDSIQATGSKRGSVEIDSAGGQNASGPTLGAIGMSGVLHRLDLLVRSYIAAGIITTLDEPEGLVEGSAQLDADGTQALFVGGMGLEDVEFGEVVLNESRDAALLSIVDSSGDVHTARLSAEQFVVTADGLGVRFFANIDDLDFSMTNEELVTDEFEDYRNAIDQVLGEM